MLAGDQDTLAARALDEADAGPQPLDEVGRQADAAALAGAALDAGNGAPLSCRPQALVERERRPLHALDAAAALFPQPRRLCLRHGLLGPQGVLGPLPLRL